MYDQELYLEDARTTRAREPRPDHQVVSAKHPNFFAELEDEGGVVTFHDGGNPMSFLKELKLRALLMRAPDRLRMMTDCG